MFKDYKSAKKVLGLLIAPILLMGVALGVSSEYKNTLNKVEVQKESDNNYSVNLYTAHTISEPVKVIKKSDLSYYILLPETKNASGQASTSSSDIKNVSAATYNYAGADVENGYTKINITTTKPINFTVNNKTQAKVASANPTSSEKKNSVSSASQNNAQKVAAAQPIEKITTKKVQNQQASQNATKVATQNALNQSPRAQKAYQNNEKVTLKQPSKQVEVKKETVKKDLPKENLQTVTLNNSKKNIEVTPPKKVAPKKKIAPANPENTPILPYEREQIKNYDKKANKLETPPEENIVEDKSSFLGDEVASEPIPKNEEEISDNEEETSGLKEVESVPSKILSSLKEIKTSIQARLAQYGLDFGDVGLIALGIIVVLLALLFILTRKKDSSARLKSKSDFATKIGSESSLTPKESDETVEGKEQVFQEPSEIVLDEQLKNPEESQIIQNVLNDNVEQKPEVTVAPAIEEVEEEPKMISNVEIAPNRGFMLVTYRNTIRLVGYIFDDVYALYNFKRAKLDDYGIKFRLSEKTEEGVNFIVKVEDVKVLVSVSKTSMKLIVVM